MGSIYYYILLKISLIDEKQTALRPSARRKALSVKSVTNTELRDKRTVSFNIALIKIGEKISSVTYHFKKTSARMIVLLMDLEVSGKLVYPRGKNGDLHLRGTRVSLVGGVFGDDSLLFSLCHIFHLVNIIIPICEKHRSGTGEIFKIEANTRFRVIRNGTMRIITYIRRFVKKKFLLFYL